jgi:DNA-binding transcriptional LysR family regulator
MELRHVRYFVTVADAGGFSKAAARLRITQPALWRQIRNFETELGLKLFERVGRRARLTVDGNDLLTRGRDLLAHAESLGERARVLTGGQTGTLRVGATPMTIESVLAGFSAQWSRHHHGVEVRLTEDSGSRLLDQLERGELEFAVTVWGDRRFRSRALESGAPHTLIALARAGWGIAVIATNVRIAQTRVRVAPVLVGGRPLGVWVSINWDPRRFLSPYAESFIEDLVAFTARSYPGKEFRLVLPRPRAGEPLSMPSTK